MKTTIEDEAMNMKERTQSDSSVPKIPIDFSEFKRRYNELLNHHLQENSYHDELTFIKMWFDRYSKLSDLLQKIAKPEPLTLLEKRGLKALGTKNHYSDLELSFSLICKFLKKTKKEVKTELKTKTVAPQQYENINTDEVKKNKLDYKISHTVMNEAILSIQASMADDIKIPQQHEAVKLDQVKKNKQIKPKKEFKDFFNTDVKTETIEKIQKEFKNYEGKKLAILIYLLQSEFKLSTYSLDSKTDGRKHFVESLINKTIPMQGINKCFASHTYKLDIRNVEKDNDYISTKEKLSKTII